MEDEEFSLGCAGWTGVTILIILLKPVISFWLCYFGGWAATLIIGDQLCTALNLLFNTTRFNVSIIPWCAAALGWIGGYFKSVSYKKK